MSFFSYLIPKLNEISKSYIKNFEDDLQKALAAYDEEYRRGLRKTRELPPKGKNKRITTLQSIDEDEDAPKTETELLQKPKRKLNNRNTKSAMAKEDSDIAPSISQTVNEEGVKRLSRKRSKEEVEGITSPEPDKRLKRNASVKAQNIISKQVNVNLNQKMRREDSADESKRESRSRRKGRKNEDKENVLPNMPAVITVKQEKLSMPSEPPLECDTLPIDVKIKQEVHKDDIAMPPPAAPIRKPRKGMKEKAAEEWEKSEEEGSRRRGTRNRKQNEAVSTSMPSTRSTRASTRADSSTTRETDEARPKRTRNKKRRDSVEQEPEKEVPTSSQENVTMSPTEKPRPKRTRRVPQKYNDNQIMKKDSPDSTVNDLEKVIKKDNLATEQCENDVLSPILQQKPKKGNNEVDRNANNANIEKDNIGKTASEEKDKLAKTGSEEKDKIAKTVIEENDKLEKKARVEMDKAKTDREEKEKLTKISREENDKLAKTTREEDDTLAKIAREEKDKAKTAMEEKDKLTKTARKEKDQLAKTASDENDKLAKTTSEIKGKVEEVAPKSPARERDSFLVAEKVTNSMDETVILPNGKYIHIPESPKKKIVNMNETVMIGNSGNSTFVLEKPPTSRAMNETFNKDVQASLTEDESIMTEDNSDVQHTPPGQNMLINNPLSAVKEKVQQFEEMASRVTRTKTRAMAKKEETENQTPPDNVGINGTKSVLSADTLRKMNNLIFNGKVTQISSSATKPRANIVTSVKSFLPSSTSKVTTFTKHKEIAEDAQRKKEALLEAKKELQRKKREDKMAAAAAVREAAERERIAALEATQREKMEKQVHVNKGKMERLKEAERRKQELARKVAETEERRRADELARQQRLEEDQRRADQLRKRQQEEAEAVKKEAAIMAKEMEKRQKEYLEKQKMNKHRLKSGEADKKHTPLKTLCSGSAIPAAEPVYMADGFECLNSDSECEEPVSRAVPSWSSSKGRLTHLQVQSYIRQLHVDRLFSVRIHSPDLREIFPDIDRRELKRTSSAVWRTPPARLPALPE